MQSELRPTEPQSPTTARPSPEGLEAVIGLEVHVQLATETKLFCRCPARFGAPPNTMVCDVCLGYPGALPVLDPSSVEQAIRLALALGATVHDLSLFERKHYFYADLPKGYQITQLDHPLATGGSLPLGRSGKHVAIERLHLEEDAGKLIHREGESPRAEGTPAMSRVDFNRAGIPLVEIVSAPELSSPEEAEDYLRTLHGTLLFTATSKANLEEGSLRCDANISLRAIGSKELGPRTEIKNLNSFRNIARALEEEIHRQRSLYAQGRPIALETRGFDADSGTTYRLRGKEAAEDYRYFPEPDLPVLEISPNEIERLSNDLPELPWRCRARFERLGVETSRARQIATDPAMARYFDRALAVLPETVPPAELAKWLCGEVLHGLKVRDLELDRALAPGRLAEVVGLVTSGKVSRAGGRDLLDLAWDTTDPVHQLAEDRGLFQVGDDDVVGRWIDEVLAEHREEVAQYRAGRRQILGYLMGRVMARSSGRAEPKLTREILRRRLESGAGEGDGGARS